MCSLESGTGFCRGHTVVSALGSAEPDGLRLVDLPATQRLAAAAKEAGVGHFVLCSTIGAVPTPGVPEHLVRAFAPRGGGGGRAGKWRAVHHHSSRSFGGRTHGRTPGY